mgnify:CR=1 FL=1
MSEKVENIASVLIAVAVFLGIGIWVGRWFYVPPKPTPKPTVIPTEKPTTPPTPTTRWTPLVECNVPPSVSDDKSKTSLRKALTASLKYYKRRRPTDTVKFGPHRVSISEMRRNIADVRDAVTKWGMSDKFFNWLSDNFRYYRCKAKVMTVTGYFLASLRGSWQKSKKHKYPIYKRPKDLCRISLKRFPFWKDFKGLRSVIKGRVTTGMDVFPYWTREEIDFGGSMDGKNQEILWVDCLVELHNLHVQGSGMVQMKSGENVLIGYADANGHRFQGIGGYLIREGIAPPGVRTSTQINSFLKKNPQMWSSVFKENPSYVFFRKLKEGPVGCLAVNITPHRTIACDHRYFPSGALALLECERPIFSKAGRVIRWEKFRRLVVNQDAGGAIKGADHIDLYCGYGKKNERIAGAMKQPGTLWFLRRK